MKRFHRIRAHCDRGATAVEYSLMVAAISAVIIATVVTLGAQVLSLFNTAVTALP